MIKIHCVIIFTFLLAPVVLAADTVVFTDGRALTVNKHEFDGERIILTMEGGGTVAFECSRVREVRSINPATGEVVIEAVKNPAPEIDCDSIIEELAEKHDIDPTLVKAIIKVESNYNANAISPKGAQGIMQLMPQTAARFDVNNVFDPKENIEGGMKYLKFLMKRYNGRFDLILAAYNAGEDAVDKYGGIPPYRETIEYILKVLRFYNKS